MRGNDTRNMVMCEELYCITGYQTEEWCEIWRIWCWFQGIISMWPK